jgi:predicted DNA-binding WGR domain protein
MPEPAALMLFRTDPARNMCRFYHMAVQLDLFGAWCFVREWGRIGRAGQLLTIPFATEKEARAAFDQQRRTKARRGYISSAG